MKRKVKINVADRSGKGSEVLRAGKLSMPKRIVKFLFGDFCEVMVLRPGKTVVGVEICEQNSDSRTPEKGDSNE